MSDTNKRTSSTRSSGNSQIFNRKRGKRLTSSVAEEGDDANSHFLPISTFYRPTGHFE